MPDERTGIRAKTGMHDAGIGNAAGAYRARRGLVFGESLVGILTAPDKHPTHEEMVCGKCLNAMHKPCSQYPTQGKVGITHMTARTYKRWAGGHSACMGRTLRSASRGGLMCIVSAACRYAGKLREAENAFLYCCVCVFEQRTSFDRAPAGGFLVRRPRVFIAGSKGRRSRPAQRPAGEALTVFPLSALLRV